MGNLVPVHSWPSRRHSGSPALTEDRTFEGMVFVHCNFATSQEKNLRKDILTRRNSLFKRMAWPTCFSTVILAHWNSTLDTKRYYCQKGTTCRKNVYLICTRTAFYGTLGLFGRTLYLIVFEIFFQTEFFIYIFIFLISHVHQILKNLICYFANNTKKYNPNKSLVSTKVSYFTLIFHLFWKICCATFLQVSCCIKILHDAPYNLHSTHHKCTVTLGPSNIKISSFTLSCSFTSLPNKTSNTVQMAQVLFQLFSLSNSAHRSLHFTRTRQIHGFEKWNLF